MKCAKCGNKLTGKENFCRICGTPVKQSESIESIPNKKNNKEKIKKSDNSIGRKIELTGNIDVTKIKIGNTIADNLEDVSGDEIKITKESADKEFKAMLEITSTENQSKKNLDVNVDSSISLIDDKNTIDEFKTKDNEMKIDIMPGEANSLEIQSTSELEELLLDNSQDNKIAESVLAEKKHLEFNKSTEDELNETTMFVPDELISNSRGVDDTNSLDKKMQELNEVTTPILPVTSKVDKINASSNQIELEEKLRTAEALLNQKEDSVRKSEKIPNNDNKSLAVFNDETENSNTISSNESNNVLDLNSLANNNDISQVFSQPNQPKKRGKIGIIILVLLLIICISSLGYLGYRLFISNDELNNLKDENKLLNDKLDKAKEATDNEQSPNNDVASLKINGYDILLDDNNEYAIEGESLLIKSAQNNIVVRFGLNINYTSIKEDKDSYKELLGENDYEVKSYGTKVVDNREYVVYEVETKKDEQILVAYTSLSDKNTICFMISDSDNKINYDFLNSTNAFINSLKINYSYEDIQDDFFIKEENAS